MPIQLMVWELKPMCDFPASPTNGGDQEEHGDAAPDIEANVSALSPGGCLGNAWGNLLQRKGLLWSSAHMLRSGKIMRGSKKANDSF